MKLLAIPDLKKLTEKELELYFKRLLNKRPSKKTKKLYNLYHGKTL